MKKDPLEDRLDIEIERNGLQENIQENYIDIIDPSSEWTMWRDTLATQMFNSWRAQRGIN